VANKETILAGGIIPRGCREGERRMYYRVALYQSAIQVNPSPTWQWKSTVLRELAAVFEFLRLHRALPQDRLRVFSSSSDEDLDEQLARENQGLGSPSVTAAQFLQEKTIRYPEMTRGTLERDEGADRRWQPSLMGAIAARSHPSVKENGTAGNGLVGTGMSALERRRLGTAPPHNCAIRCMPLIFGNP
jgi:hypothetical protein